MTASQTDRPHDNPHLCDQLNERCGREGRLRFEPGHAGMTRAVLTLGDADAHVYLHGAHVTHFQPAGHEPVLWLSERAVFEPGQAIRGGVPICFPWFGPPHEPYTADPKAPAHGVVRTRDWALADARADDLRTIVTLTTQHGPLSLDYRVSLEADRLELSLRVENHRDTPTPYELALHSYLAVGDAREVTIAGLEGAEYLDKAPPPGSDTPPDHATVRREGDAPIRFTAETDRVYLDTEAECVLTDPVLGRRLYVGKRGSRATVVWNPWVAKSRRMADFGDDEWPGMCCIETGCIDRHAIQLAGGQHHTTTATLRAERL